MRVTPTQSGPVLLLVRATVCGGRSGNAGQPWPRSRSARPHAMWRTVSTVLRPAGCRLRAREVSACGVCGRFAPLGSSHAAGETARARCASSDVGRARRPDTRRNRRRRSRGAGRRGNGGAAQAGAPLVEVLDSDAQLPLSKGLNAQDSASYLAQLEEELDFGLEMSDSDDDLDEGGIRAAHEAVARKEGWWVSDDELTEDEALDAAAARADVEAALEEELRAMLDGSSDDDVGGALERVVSGLNGGDAAPEAALALDARVDVSEDSDEESSDEQVDEDGRRMSRRDRLEARKAWMEAAQRATSRPSRLQVAEQLAATAAVRELDLPLKAARLAPDERPITLRHRRIEMELTRVLSGLFTAGLPRDADLFPGGLPLDVVVVTLSSDLRSAVVDWALPMPTGSRTAPRTLDDAATRALGAEATPFDTDSEDEEDRPVRQAGARRVFPRTGYDYGVDLESVASDPVFAPHIERQWRQRVRRKRRSMSRGQKRRQAEAAEESTEHLSPAVGRRVAVVSRALRRNAGEIRRLANAHLYLKYSPKLRFRRSVAMEEEAFLRRALHPADRVDGERT